MSIQQEEKNSFYVTYIEQNVLKIIFECGKIIFREKIYPIKFERRTSS